MGHSSRFCKNKISLYQSYWYEFFFLFWSQIPNATNLLNYSRIRPLWLQFFFILTLTAYICSKSGWSHISSQIFRFAVFYPTQQGIQHTPDFSPLCFLFSKMKDNISSKQPLLTFHHYMSSIVVVADWQAQNKKWAGVGFGYNWKCQKDVLKYYVFSSFLALLDETPFVYSFRVSVSPLVLHSSRNELI